jgi:cation transport ATPase
MIAFRTLWAACVDIFEELFLVFAANALWCAVASPVPYLAVEFAQRELYLGMIVCAVLAPLPFALASGGLTTLARRFVDGKATPWRELLSGVSVNMGQRVKVMYVWAGVFYTCLVNIWFYANQPDFAYAYFVAFFFVDVALLWLTLLAFLLPVHEILGTAPLGKIFRNALGLMFSVAGAALVILVIGSALFVFSTLVYIVMIFFFGMFLALWGARTTDVAIARLQDRIAAEAQKPDEDSGERRPAGQVRPK